MPDSLNPAVPTQAEAVTQAPTQAPEVQEAKLTQADVDRIVADRLKREQTKAEKEKTAAVEEALKRSKLEDSERLALEKKELEEKLSTFEKAAKDANLKLSLTGKVQDVNAAIKLLEDKHFDDTGAINTELFLADYPFLAPQPVAGATPMNGGSLQTGTTPETLKDVLRKRLGV